MVTCQLFFAQQYQLGFVVTVLNMYTIHNESHLGFNNNDKTSKGDFQKMSSSSSHFRLHSFSLPCARNPSFRRLGMFCVFHFCLLPLVFPFVFLFSHRTEQRRWLLSRGWRFSKKDDRHSGFRTKRVESFKGF